MVYRAKIYTPPPPENTLPGAGGVYRRGWRLKFLSRKGLKKNMHTPPSPEQKKSSFHKMGGAGGGGGGTQFLPGWFLVNSWRLRRSISKTSSIKQKQYVILPITIACYVGEHCPQGSFQGKESLELQKSQKQQKRGHFGS